MRVMPDGIDVDIAKLKADTAEAVSRIGKLAESKEVPFAFGLKALQLNIVMEDAEGGPEMVEEALAAVPGVQGVELLEMGRLF